MNKAQTLRLTTAHSHYQKGKFDEAETIYRELHDADHRHVGVLTRLGEIALWRNQGSIAENYFRSAIAHTSWIENKWPLNVNLNTLLAMSYYRQNRLSEASTWFKKSAGLIPVGPFSNLKALGEQFALFDSHTAYSIEGPDEVQVSFTQIDPLPVIEVSINGHDPVFFIIDTGGAEVILDTQFAEQVGVTFAGSFHAEGGGTKGTLRLGKVNAITIGEVTIKNIPVHIMSTGHFTEVFEGLPITGVIGTRLLMQFLSTIDYTTGRLILRKKTSTKCLDTPQAKIIPFWLLQTHYIVTHGSINGTMPSLFFIDTGLAGMGFSGAEKTLREAEIIVDWSKLEDGIAMFGKSQTVKVTAHDVTIGTGDNTVSIKHVSGVVFRKPFAITGNKLGLYVGGVVSHQFFRNFAVTFDFTEMQLVMQKA